MTTDDPPPIADRTAPAADAPPVAAGPQQRAPAQASRAQSPVTAPEPEPEGHPDVLLAIRQACWSQVDRNKSVRTLEARAEWVDKCIAERSRTRAPQ